MCILVGMGRQHAACEDSYVGTSGKLSSALQAGLHPGAGHLVHAGGALRQNHSRVAQSRVPFAA